MTSAIPSKEDRQAFVSNIWQHLLPFKVKILVNKNDHVRVEPVDAKGSEVYEFWASLLEEICEIDGVADVATGRFQPGQGVIVKVNPHSGSMKIKGENYWHWFVGNFERMLNQSTGTTTMGPLRGDHSMPLHHVQSGPILTPHPGLPNSNSMPVLYSAPPTNMAELTLPDRINLVDSLLGDLPKTGAIRGGLSYIYPLWRALIGLWLAQNKTVTIATSQLDSERFADILTLMIACCDTTDFQFQVSVYAPIRCDLGRKFSHVADVARRIVESRRKKRKFITMDKLNWAMRAVQVKHAKSINYNFISGHSTYDGEMMVTSGSFHKQHMITNASSSVWFTEISTESLKKHYIQALFASCVETQL